MGFLRNNIYSVTHVKLTKMTFVLIRLHSHATIQRYNVIDNLFALRVLLLMFIKSQQLPLNLPHLGSTYQGKGLTDGSLSRVWGFDTLHNFRA